MLLTARSEKDVQVITVKTTGCSRVAVCKNVLLRIARGVIDGCVWLVLVVFVWVPLGIIVLPIVPFILWRRALDWGVRRLIPELIDYDQQLWGDQVLAGYCCDVWRVNEDKVLTVLLLVLSGWLTFVCFHGGGKSFALWIYPLLWLTCTIYMSYRTMPFLNRHRLRQWALNDMNRRGVPLCRNCGYPTRGIFGEHCPECGTPVSKGNTNESESFTIA